MLPILSQEYSESKLFLYGGVNTAGAALNDAWLYDVQNKSWECVFFGHSSLVLPTGSIGGLLQVRTCVCISYTSACSMGTAVWCCPHAALMACCRCARVRLQVMACVFACVYQVLPIDLSACKSWEFVFYEHSSLHSGSIGGLLQVVW